VLIIYIVNKYESKPDNEKYSSNLKNSAVRILRFWYGVPLILYFFKEVYMIINLINSPLIDSTLINIDYSIFGINPTQWVSSFDNPLLTELLEIVYFLYYIVIIIYGLELYLRKRYDEFKFGAFIIFLGFYLCYIAYMFFPAVGPRFFLHNFSLIDKELPGLFFTDWIRHFLNFAESIPANVPNPQDYVQRDAMPSAHAEIAILLAYLSRKVRSRSFYFYFPYCILMIIATVYLRYHYVIDIIAGGLMAVITIWLSGIINKSKPTVKLLSTSA
jgi:membrane-associated phospholipid phosphatase